MNDFNSGKSDRPDPSRFANAFVDDFARLATSAAGLAKGAKDEMETLFRSRIDRWLADRDFVSREEHEAVKEMARLAREENQRLSERLDSLEKRASSTE